MWAARREALIALKIAGVSRSALAPAYSCSNRTRRALTRLIDKLETQSVHNAEFLEADKRFHRHLSDMTGNPVLTEVMTVLWNKRYSPMFTYLETFYADADIPFEMNADHSERRS
ncbi:hypothetical protein BUMB_03618c [Candidatus Paraburkholderia calva]|nr:hypothetical protein BUMB_03618c [Candidatus Paraburkholderia calva]